MLLLFEHSTCHGSLMTVYIYKYLYKYIRVIYTYKDYIYKGLYPNIPHDEGLIAIRKALDLRKDKRISTVSYVISRICFKH